jgi:23S rRNA (cytidine1920-2'-O)/16S rRNA (cytidine1409-2'-O)-methyltransferase
LHPTLAGDPRLLSLEGRDIRSVGAAELPEAPALAVIDASFISLRLVLPAVAALLASSAAIVALIKPQFEAGRAALKKGVVRDAAVQEEVCRSAAAVLAGLGFAVSGPVDSPIEGGDGNREFLVAGRR